MAQWRSLTAELGFNEDAWIDASPQPYSAGANASGSGANQVAPDDRASNKWGTQWPVRGAAWLGSHDLPGALIEDTSLEVDDASLQHSGISPEPPSAISDQDAMADSERLRSRIIRGVSHMDGQLSPTFQFVSGAVVLEDKTNPRNKQRPTKPDTGFKCEHPGCTYRGTFNRVYDLQRHMTKHGNVPKDNCPMEFCERYFDRYDKLRHHLKTVHVDSEEAICPISQCSVRIPFTLMWHHSRAHSQFRAVGVVEKAWRDRTGSSFRSCPIPSCKHSAKKLQAYELQEHLRQHAKQERDRNFEAILAAGYDPVSVKVVCPVCKIRLPALDDFEHHLQNEHIFKNEYYNGQLREKTTRWGYYDFEFWMTKPVSDSTAWYFSVKTDAHIPNLRPYDEYAQHRWAILRLWPNFRYHPLFDEFRVAGDSEQSAT